MKANIDENGKLVIRAETDKESHLLRCYIEDNHRFLEEGVSTNKITFDLFRYGKPDYFQYNICDYVYIRITDEGMQYIKNKYNESYIKYCIEGKKVEINQEIWYRFQCFEVFKLFPVDIFKPAPFKFNVMFESVYLNEIFKVNK